MPSETFILTTGTDLSGSTDTLYTPNGYTLINTNPYYFVRSGSVNGSTLYSFTGGALYWSSTAVSASQAYYLGFNSGAVYPANRSYRSDGRSLRCVATNHAPDARAVIAIAPVDRIQSTGVRVQVVSVGTTTRRSGPVVQAGSSVPVLIWPQVARTSKVEWMSAKFIPTISLITNINYVTRARVCAVGDNEGFHTWHYSTYDIS